MTEQRLPPSMRDRVPFLLYRAAEHSHALANYMLAWIGLTARQAGILTLVIEREPMTQKALADDLGIDRTTMVALIDDLERKGLVARQRHPQDRRAFLIRPTESGQAAKARAIEILDEQQRRFLAPLTPAEQQQLGVLLKRLQQPPDRPLSGHRRGWPAVRSRTRSEPTWRTSVNAPEASARW